MESISKRNLAWILVVTVVLLAVLSIFIKTSLSKYTKGSLGKINSIVAQNRKETITVWGASTAYVHVDPVALKDITGLTAFNLGLDGVNYDQYKGLLNHYAKQDLSGKKVVIAVNIQEFHERTAVKEISNYLHTLDDDDIYKALVDIDPAVWKARYIPFYNLTLYDKNAFLKLLDIYGLKPQPDRESLGFLAQDLFWEGDTLTSPSKVNFSPKLFDEFTNSVSFLETSGAEVYIVLTPCYAGTRGYLKETDLVIENLKQLDNDRSVFFMNFYDHLLTSDRALFYNNFHLNGKGARVLTELIGRAMKQHE